MKDQELVKRLLDEDADAFELLVKNTEGLVAHIVFKMVAIAEDRKDLVQDIYFSAYKHIKTFKFQSKLTTWIGSIAYNTCYNYLQKKKVLLIEEKQDEEMEEHGIETLANRMAEESGNEVLNKIFRAELRAILNTGIRQLPPLYATLITLYHYQELSYQEISQITNLPEGTLKSYLFRARKQIKDYVLLNYIKEDL